MTDETTPEAFTGDAVAGEQNDQAPEGQNDPAAVSEAPSDVPDVFSREYVTELRDEAKTQRLRARDAESERDRLREHLWVARVDALGVLADPTDLPVDVDALDDLDAIRAAAEHPGGVVALLGKGHETGQEIQGVVTPFDDRLVAAEVLRTLAQESTR